MGPICSTITMDSTLTYKIMEIMVIITILTKITNTLTTMMKVKFFYIYSKFLDD